MGLREVRSELQLLDKEQLLFHLSELYKKYPDVKEYLDFYSNPDETALVEKFKGKILEGYYPTRGWRLKLGKSRKAINAFKKLGVSPTAECILLLFFVQAGVQYAREKNPRNEAYYTRLEKAFDTALKHMQKHALVAEFESECQSLVERAEPMPWKFGDHLKTILEQYRATA